MEPKANNGSRILTATKHVLSRKPKDFIGHLFISQLVLSRQLCKCLDYFLTQVMADHDKSTVRDMYFILLETCRGYILETHVFSAPTKLWREELQRGTILQEQPSNDPHEKTFVVAHRKEVHLDCETTCLAGRLDRLTDEAAEQLLKISSLEDRYESHLHQHRRVQEQHQGEGAEGERLKENPEKRSDWVKELRELLRPQESLEEELKLVKQAREEAAKRVDEKRVVNLSSKEERIIELERKLSAAQQKLDEYGLKEPSDWVISREEIHMTDTCLGIGGWGTVVLGTFRGCKVAVKQFYELILSPDNRRLFEREMNIASRCRHPCLLQFIGATNDEESPLFVTELMELSLRELLQQRPLSHTDISVISLDIAQALNYLHKSEPPIIHRDISSANVLLWRHGDQWRGKVSDYGAANFMQQTITIGPGAMIYSSPEALTPHQTVKMDVYSYGVLLCEMCIRDLPDPKQRNKQVALVTNDVFRELIQHCIEREPEARPTMEEIIHDLDSL